MFVCIYFQNEYASKNKELFIKIVYTQIIYFGYIE